LTRRSFPIRGHAAHRPARFDMGGDAAIMSDCRSEMLAQIKTAQEKSGFALQRYFYRSQHVYETELSAIFFKSWIYAAHISEIPEPGDFTLFEMGEESFIITRDKAGDIHALINVCRHRGARVCEALRGNSKTFVCPYHAWTYNLDGSLRSARHMEKLGGFDTSDYGLKKAQVFILHGMIFMNCDPGAADPQGPFSKIEGQLTGYDLTHAKVAHQQTYSVDTNWKLCLENYLECYHCATAHKAYARLHTLEDLGENTARQNAAMRERAPDVTGIPGIAKEHRAIYGDAEQFGACASAWRYGLYDGFQTGSEDGKPVAPLMGQFKAYDGGAGDFQLGPVTFMLNYPDHCVLYRFTPRGRGKCDMHLVWFVKGTAEEGVDYDVGTLTALWDKTTREDQYIIMRNSAGVNSQFFEPGPFQPEFENVSMQFTGWYLDTLERACD